MSLELLILQTLDGYPDNILQPEVSLWHDINRASVEAVTKTDLRRTLDRLEGLDQVLVVATADVTKWKIAPKGRIRLKEARA